MKRTELKIEWLELCTGDMLALVSTEDSFVVIEGLSLELIKWP